MRQDAPQQIPHALGVAVAAPPAAFESGGPEARQRVRTPRVLADPRDHLFGALEEERFLPFFEERTLLVGALGQHHASARGDLERARRVEIAIRLTEEA